MMDVYSSLNKQQLHDLFYSDLLKELRVKHYKAAYEQGRFDEYAETTYGKCQHFIENIKKE